MPYPCSTCDVCRNRRKRLWSSRLMLESYTSSDSCFATVTYDNDHLPKTVWTNHDGKIYQPGLYPKDATDWLKRLRLALAPKKIRYFLAGEYGDETWRPHYHAALFGVSALQASIVQDTWGMGHTVSGDLTPESSAYIAGYVTKKMTKKTDARLAGRYPEFTRMSLKPGLGAKAMEEFANAIKKDSYQSLLDSGDVPFQFRDGGNLRLFGTYLRRRLRGELGYESTKAPQIALDKYRKEMLQLLKENVNFTPHETRFERQMKIQDFILDKDTQVLRNVLSRARVFASKKSI